MVKYIESVPSGIKSGNSTSTYFPNATTAEQLDTLKESVDTIQKEIAESKNNESEN